MIVELNKKKFAVNSNEFNLIETSEEFCNLKLVNKLGLFERIVSLIKELSKINNKKTIGIFFNQTHGGYIPIECAPFIDDLFIFNSDTNNININNNILTHNIENITFLTNFDFLYDNHKESNIIIFSEKYEYELIDKNIIEKFNPIILTTINNTLDLLNYHTFKLTNSKYSLLIPNMVYDDFYKSFYCFIQKSNTLNYDNLIHLCIMVKNGGELFEKMLLENFDLIDRWTILDTGSTDNTIDIINKVLVGKKKGELYSESFINFCDSRNRLLELAGKICKFILMLDDSYIVKGDLRWFLDKIRSDQFSDSASLYIHSGDVEYSSNRIVKSNNELKYIYKIHEIIQDYDNVNIFIPKKFAYIIDENSDYMSLRTINRKQLDLKLLFEELEEDPNNSRTYYYLGQTYNFIENYERAYHFYIERMNHTNEGFIQEKIDAIFEAARIAHFKLNKPWNICQKLYLKAHSLDNKRPDSLYFLGIYYYFNDQKNIAFNYFKEAFNIGYPKHCQYSLKPTLSFYFLPKLLTELCYTFEDFELGEKCTKLFLENNQSNVDEYEIMISWHNIFIKLNTVNLKLDKSIDISVIQNEKKPLLCFVADGGFEPWTGSDILNKGVGGSETYIIEMARYIQKNGYFKVIVFCNCINKNIFENVEYIPIGYFGAFVKSTYIHTCIISRFTEYIPLAIKNQTKNVYLVLHDLMPNGVIIPIDNKLKNIFCLSEWHVKYFLNIFPQFENITIPFYYGIDIFKFDSEVKLIKETNLPKQNIQFNIFEITQKIPFKFIYSSFPNRGLFELLKMWINIVSRYPKASLHIYSDVDGKWVNNVVPDLMKEIKKILNFYENNSKYNVYCHGWVNKDILAEAWKTSEYWFYPCTFEETFCLTAVEAALSKTLAITNGLAALQNTVGERGICIEGNATTDEWKKKALNELFFIMENKHKKEELINLNYEWASKLSWENQANKLLNDYFLHN